jgi:endonuclease/exonuclease/phosphatase family metal-dependent hydrolase
VRGFNEELKQQIWEDYCLSNKLDIISITETKIAADNPITTLQKSKHFTYLWSCTDSAKAGTAIMIHKSIKSHIHKIHTCPGYAIAVDLFFKHDFKFRIISVYLPCNDSHIRLHAQNTIIQWFQQAITSNIQPIILGDFNASNDNTQSLSIKYKLLHFLQFNNMYNLATHTETLAPTWHSSRDSSSIDYIWANQPILRYLTSYYMDDPDTSTKSDHQILISSWTFPYAYIGKLRHSTKTRRRIFLYKNMNKDLWQLFTDQVTLNLNNNKTPLSTQTSESLETTWHKIQSSIITAAIQHIPNKKFNVRNFQNIFSTKASILHHHLKKLDNIIRIIKQVIKNLTPIPDKHNQLINQINTNNNLNILLLPDEHSLLPNWLTLAKQE